jgi:hypothetical protein
MNTPRNYLGTLIYHAESEVNGRSTIGEKEVLTRIACKSLKIWLQAWPNATHKQVAAHILRNRMKVIHLLQMAGYSQTRRNQLNQILKTYGQRSSAHSGQQSTTA